MTAVKRVARSQMHTCACQDIDDVGNVVCLRCFADISVSSKIQKVEHGLPLTSVHPPEKAKKGAFVGIIHELAKRWHVNLVQSTFYPVEACFEEVSDDNEGFPCWGI